jgi:hypothetical protein
MRTAKPSSSSSPFQLHTVSGRSFRADLDLDRTSELILRQDEEEFGAPALPFACVGRTSETSNLPSKPICDV